MKDTNLMIIFSGYTLGFNMDRSKIASHHHRSWPIDNRAKNPWSFATHEDR